MLRHLGMSSVNTEMTSIFSCLDGSTSFEIIPAGITILYKNKNYLMEILTNLF